MCDLDTSTGESLDILSAVGFSVLPVNNAAIVVLILSQLGSNNGRKVTESCGMIDTFSLLYCWDSDESP